MQGVTEITEDVLARYPSARNSDGLLILSYLRELGLDVIKLPDSKVSIIDALNSLKTVVRSRRRIQNEEKRFLSSKQVQKLRAKKQDEMTEWMGKTRSKPADCMDMHPTKNNIQCGLFKDHSGKHVPKGHFFHPTDQW